MQKRMRAELQRLKRIRGLSDDGRLLFARSLAATPDERWQLHVKFLRSLNLSTRSARRAFGFSLFKQTLRLQHGR